MRRLLTAVTLALLGLMVATPALAQEGTEQFANQETQDLTQQLDQQQAEYDRLQSRMQQIEDQDDDYFDNAEYNNADDRLATLDDTIPRTQADLVDARLDAIQDAPVNGSPEEQIQTYEDKIDALEALSDYNDREISGTDSFDTSSEIDDAITAAEDGIERAEADQAEAQEAESAPPADSGADSSGGSDTASSDSSGGPLATLGSVVTGIIGFFLSLFVLWALSLAVMGFVAYRRTGSAGAAASAAFRPKRIALGFLIAFVLTLFGGLGAIFAWLQVFVVIALILLAIFWWKDGSLGAALARIGSWFAPLFRINRGEDGDEYGYGGDGGPGGPQPGGPDDGRRGRNVAGAKGEAKVNEILGSLAREGRQYSYVFANLSQRGIGNIDHVYLNQFGLVVVETKSNKGAVVLDEQGNLTADGKPFSRNPFEQAESQVEAIQSTLGDTQISYMTEYYVCLAGTTNVQRSLGFGDADRLVKLDELGPSLESLRPVLSMQQVDYIANQIMGVYGTAPIASPTKPQPTGPQPSGPTVGGPSGGPTNGPQPDPPPNPTHPTGPAPTSPRPGPQEPPQTPPEPSPETRRPNTPDEPQPTASTPNEPSQEVNQHEDYPASPEPLDLDDTPQQSPSTRQPAPSQGEWLETDVDTRDQRKRTPAQTQKRRPGLTPEMRQKLAGLKDSLHQRIVGQDEAVDAVTNGIQRQRTLGSERPPSFLFMGPTGVGKTELALELHRQMFENGDADDNEMVRLDMSEYADRYQVNRMTGAPPGYIGHEEGGHLTDPVIQNPERVILLDEIEKAHEDAWTMLLQVLDAGRLTNSHNQTALFQDSVLIMTSNLFSEDLMNIWRSGDELPDERQMKNQLVKHGVKRELVNRIGRIVMFHPLTAEDVQEVARRMVEGKAKNFRETQGVEISVSDDALQKIAEDGYEEENGSRPLRGVIEREIEDRISQLLVEDKIADGDAIEFGVKDDGNIGIRRTGN